MSRRWKFRLSFYVVSLIVYTLFAWAHGPLHGWGLLLFSALVILGEQVVWFVKVSEELGRQIRRSGGAFALFVIAGLSLSAWASDTFAGGHYYTPPPTYSPGSNAVRNYTLDHFKLSPPPSFEAPTFRPMPQYNPPAQSDWRNMIRRRTRTFEVSPQKQNEWQRSDQALQRNFWLACAKYNNFCANMLRSLGE